ncbi:MAG: patatin-like phospholipase family protein [Crocinitomicaceae bacterium]|nr:patatin-like phospholipase family protein [Crocinitomicaceae bacterium]
MKNYENLVLEGGGVKGIAYAGSFEALTELNQMDAIKRVAGTSAGAIAAVLVSLRYDAAEIKQILTSTDFKSFEDRKSIFRVLTKYGLYKGDAFLKWMKSQIAVKMGNGDATFKDFHDKGMRDLKIFSCDLNTKSVKEFSFEKTPSVKVAEAGRASMSIPFFFSAWKFSDGIPDNHVYVDGGTAYNYPITCFDTDCFNEKTIGLHLDDLNEKNIPSDLKYYRTHEYVKALFTTLMSTQNADLQRDPENLSRTIKINDHGISATNFEITTTEKDLLFNSGKAAVLAHFKESVLA